MKFQELMEQARKDVPDGKRLDIMFLIEWTLMNNRIADLIGTMKEDQKTTIALKQQYGGKTAIERLENADWYIGIANFLVAKGHFNEGAVIFREALALTPDDTTALNDYGVIILNQLLKAYRANSQFDRSSIQQAWDHISKAATLDKYLHDEPLIMPAYKNLCFLRSVEATYYFQQKDFLTAFLMAWMSIEMTTYRIWYAHLKENSYSKRKIGSLQRWNIDTIIEVLYLNKCDPDFVKFKDDLDMFRGLRNDLLHGTIFQITEGHTKRCIDLALALITIKQ